MYLRCFGALFLAGAIMLPALADDKDAKDKPDTPKPVADKDDTPKPSGESPSGKAPSNEKWTTVWDVVGTLGKVNGTSITLKVEYQDTGANPANNANTQQILHQLQQYQQQVLRAMHSHSGAGAGHHNYRSLARVQPSHNYHPTGTNNNQKAATKTKDVDLILSDEIKVRVGSPPVEFDDKGSIKKYSPEELKTLKGDSKGWGYAADTTALKTGEVVRVILAKKKTAPTGDKAKDKEAAADDGQPVVKIVWVLKEAAATAKAADKPKEKKK